MTRESSTKQTRPVKVPYPVSFRSHIHFMEDTMRSLVLIALSVVLLPNVLAARSARDSNRLTALSSWSNLKKQLHSGQRIEVVDYDLHTRKGKFVSVSSTGILLETSGGAQVMMPRTKVFRVVTHKQIQRVKNSLIGLGAGAGIGLWVAGARASDGADTSPYILAATAGIGAILGAAVAPPGVTIYRAPDSQGSIATVESPVAQQTSATAPARRSPYESSPNPRLMEGILGEEQTPPPSHITYQVVPQRQDGPAVQQPIQPISIEPAPEQLDETEFATQERS